MEIHELQSAIDHGVETGVDGVQRAVRVRVVPGQGIIIWAGTLQPRAAEKQSRDITAEDFSTRTVVHFIGWQSVRSYYRDTPFAGLIDSVRERTLRFSTLPPSTKNDDPGG